MPKDKLHRFIFDNTPIRGNIVRLNQTFNTALQHQHCPPVLRKALGELMAASALLAATLKLEDGAIVLQIQGKGALKLLVVECTAGLGMRATAKWSGDLEEASLAELVGDGHFIITLDPKDGNQTYQGIVPLEGDSIAEILQNYMQRSEQIETRIWLACDEESSAGMLLQKLPDLPEQDADAWARTGFLADTVQDAELLGLPVETLLQRLFSEEDVRLFEAQHVQFHCSCSRLSVSNMLRLLGSEEVHAIIEEQGNIEVNCDFCNAGYRFDKVDAEQLFSSEIIIPASKARH
ncbi:MAG: Hsp33 family molecular chaperone HslO [Candidatus Methylopumilus sp.]